VLLFGQNVLVEDILINNGKNTVLSEKCFAEVAEENLHFTDYACQLRLVNKHKAFKNAENAYVNRMCKRS